MTVKSLKDVGVVKPHIADKSYRCEKCDVIFTPNRQRELEEIICLICEKEKTNGEKLFDNE